VAREKITHELGSSPHSAVLFHQLDITDETSCKKFASFLSAKHGQIHALINNAGFAFPFDATEPADVQADVTIGINYYGTKLASQHLVPLIRNGGRLVNVCSQMGHMKTSNYRDNWIAKLGNPDVTVSEIDHFVETYKQCARENTRKENGFPESAYRVSKAAEIALTMIQHRELTSKGIVVNACCPGYVATDMTKHNGTLSVEQGADTPVFLALDPGTPCGCFVYQRQPVQWPN